MNSSKSSYRSHAVIIATGFFDIHNKLNIKGEDLNKVSHYFEDANFYANQKVLIVGGNNSAVDAALSCYRAGAHVTMVIRGPSIGERVKYWVRPEIINRIEDQSISAYYESTLEEIQDDHVHINTANGPITLANYFVLLITGYQPDYDFLNRIGVTVDQDTNKTPIYDEQTLESSVSGLYLAGVVLGGLKTNRWFIENSREHAERVCDNIETQKEAHA